MSAPRSTSTDRSPRRAGRRRRVRRRRLALVLAASLAVAGGAVAVVMRPMGGPPAGAPTVQARAVPPETATPAPSPTPSPTPTPAPTPPTPTAGPTSGKGTFTTAEADGKAVGKGTVRRYKVEVEDGIGIDPKAVATQVQAILADKRGWTADGVDGFQLVSSGTYDFTVRIASPDTVDRICATAGLNTKGEVNCDVGSQVMVNSKRWNTGSPEFSGPLDEYRALIVNHEVGHRIGHGHESCPGKGKPAPAMMQQIYGLNGCVANAWPYTADGHYISGPAAP
ncbi:DUF3152 domain-containing protein [Kitasatospora paracochleata]|uniref:DUF3152 domain-containing protein n=1 Tax=Kitasatospora paracochleata TaxID=58354 RepID=A0ABT1J7A9_9ACTN|nr:DUF3152 domain-containing protein [Kitasatospora paracochleata]MCP2313099.1 hypothetical protein [Kitasatospora paracochleata]